VSAEQTALLAARHLDLVQAPFTLPSSRLLLFREGEGVRVHTAEYERPLAQCRVLDALTLWDGDGRPLPLSAVRAHEVVFGEEAATLTFAGPGALSVGGHADDVEVRWIAPDGTAAAAQLVAGAGLVLEVHPDRSVHAAPTTRHTIHRTATEAVWRDWFARCPVVRNDLQEMTAFCWWVLGANIVALPGLDDARAVVPSKIGYVGLWQWDAYFIAVGLRHGDAALAREQLDLALRFAGADGQLPDVVHEEGILASSDDLPPADRETLRRAGSMIADPTAAVPLTKPPLTAWALRQVLDVDRTPATLRWARARVATIRRAQDWWFAQSDLDADGMPEYGHPYSSGLDDSPVFDGELPTASPDLAAYLVLQDLELARFADEFGDADAVAHRVRAKRTMSLLLTMWDPARGAFLARAAGMPTACDAIVGLMPLLTGALPRDVRDTLVQALCDPRRYGTPWPLPTVAVGDPDFSAERMWRGPVWVNTNVLVAEGLERSGCLRQARALRERTAALVIHAGGPHEYFHPLTGLKARTATTAFGWSAALFIDLAVRLSS